MDAFGEKLEDAKGVIRSCNSKIRFVVDDLIDNEIIPK
jgi:hypothetical protein